MIAFMALLLAGGLGPALIAQGIGSVIQDVASGKVGWRSRFNLGQYPTLNDGPPIPAR